MNNSERQDLLDSHEGIDCNIEMGDADADGDAYMQPPPGTEGAEHSHAGDENLVSELGEGMRRRTPR